MTDEVLKLALDALEGFIPYLPLKDEAQCNRYDKAITALRLAIDAQNMASKSTYKEQLETKDEPVAWYCKEGLKCGVSLKQESPEWAPLYTTPQCTWVGLDIDEFKFIASKYLLNREVGLEYFQEEIEDKLKELNT